MSSNSFHPPPNHPTQPSNSNKRLRLNPSPPIASTSTWINPNTTGSHTYNVGGWRSNPTQGSASSAPTGSNDTLFHPHPSTSHQNNSNSTHERNGSNRYSYQASTSDRPSSQGHSSSQFARSNNHAATASERRQGTATESYHNSRNRADRGIQPRGAGRGGRVEGGDELRSIKREEGLPTLIPTGPRALFSAPSQSPAPSQYRHYEDHPSQSQTNSSLPPPSAPASRPSLLPVPPPPPAPHLASPSLSFPSPVSTTSPLPPSLVTALENKGKRAEPVIPENVDRIHLPLTCRGTSPAAVELRKAFIRTSIQTGIAFGRGIPLTQIIGDYVELEYPVEIDVAMTEDAVEGKIGRDAEVDQLESLPSSPQPSITTAKTAVPVVKSATRVVTPPTPPSKRSRADSAASDSDGSIVFVEPPSLPQPSNKSLGKRPAKSVTTEPAAEVWRNKVLKELQDITAKISAGPPSTGTSIASTTSALPKPSAIASTARRTAPAPIPRRETISLSPPLPAPAPAAIAAASSSSSKKSKLKVGLSASVSHGGDGRSNKMRLFFESTLNSYLAVSLSGSVVEWSKAADKTSVRTLNTIGLSKDRLGAACSTQDGSLILAFMGPNRAPKSTEPKVGPQHQVSIFRRREGENGTTFALSEQPHGSDGDITAITAIPSNKLRFVTAGGGDKSLYFWRMIQNHSTFTAETTRLQTNHSSLISSLCYQSSQRWLMSVSVDKRIFGYDLGAQSIVYKHVLDAPINTVQEIPSHPHSVLCTTATPTNQFHLVDVRSPSSTVIQFGFDSPAVASGPRKGEKSNLGRHIRGDFKDHRFVHSNGSTSVLVFDLRNASRAAQELAIGRSKIVQVAFDGADGLALMEASNFTYVSLIK